MGIRTGHNADSGDSDAVHKTGQHTPGVISTRKVVVVGGGNPHLGMRAAYQNRLKQRIFKK